MNRFTGSYLFLLFAMYVPSTVVLTWTEDKPLKTNALPQKQEDQQKKDNQKAKLSAADQKKKSLDAAKLKAHSAVTKRLMRVVHRGKHSPLVEFQKAIELDLKQAWSELRS